MEPTKGTAQLDTFEGGFGLGEIITIGKTVCALVHLLEAFSTHDVAESFLDLLVAVWCIGRYPLQVIIHNLDLPMVQQDEIFLDLSVLTQRTFQCLFIVRHFV